MDIAKIRTILQQKLDELVLRAQDIESRLSDPGQADWEENASEMEGDEVEFEIGQLTKREIQEIEQAIARIDQGNYGLCTECGGKIDSRRIELLPFAGTCIKCA